MPRIQFVGFIDGKGHEPSIFALAFREGEQERSILVRLILLFLRFGPTAGGGEGAGVAG